MNNMQARPWKAQSEQSLPTCTWSFFEEQALETCIAKNKQKYGKRNVDEIFAITKHWCVVKSVKRGVVKCFYERVSPMITKPNNKAKEKQHLTSTLITNSYCLSFLQKVTKTTPSQQAKLNYIHPCASIRRKSFTDTSMLPTRSWHTVYIPSSSQTQP